MYYCTIINNKNTHKMNTQANKYYNVVATINGEKCTLFGSFDKSDCKFEIETERDNWKAEGYKGIKIEVTEVNEQPDEIVYGITEDKVLECLEIALCNWDYIASGFGLFLDYSDKDYNKAKKAFKSDCLERTWINILKSGGTLSILDVDGSGDYSVDLTLELLKDNFKSAPLDLVALTLNGEGDADTDSQLIQYVLYKEVMFG